jgi:hypothetical protein
MALPRDNRTAKRLLLLLLLILFLEGAKPDADLSLREERLGSAMYGVA